MALRNIIKIGDSILTKKAKTVDTFDVRLAQLLDDMAETMHKSEGVGLAAPQVGVLKRVAVIDVGEGLIELVNPRIKKAHGNNMALEGCLSIPDLRGNVERPKKVVFEAQDRTGKTFEMTAEDFFARAVCHEIDHMDGVLFTDIAESLEEID